MEVKFKLKRIKKDSVRTRMTTPDYEGFFKTQKSEFYVLGWLDDFSNLSVRMEMITEDLLKKNKYLLSKYKEWRFSKFFK